MQQYKKTLGKVMLTPEGAWRNTKDYDILSLVNDNSTDRCYISKCYVPVGVTLDNSEYWMPLNVAGYSDTNFMIISKKRADGQLESFTIETAIASIAEVNRKVGCIICFFNNNDDRLDIGGSWEIWQFNDTNLYNWNDVNSWVNIYYNYNKFVGWFANEAKLKTRYKYPHVGMYAYVGTQLNEAVVYRCDVETIWNKTSETAKDYVKVIVKGNVTIGENGNWFVDGIDTCIPASVKGDNGKTPYFRNNANKLEYSYDEIVWYEISDYLAHYYRYHNNKLQHSNDNTIWEDVSDYISAWFRWSSDNKIQISRDGYTWSDLSNVFSNNLHISRYIGIDETLPTSGIAEGTIYAKGPTYADGDTSHSNPIYRLWVYAWKGDTLAWQDNGEFTSIVAGVVQESGDSETEVMSQKAVTKKLSELALLITRGSSYINVNTVDRTITIPGNYSIVYANTNYRIPSNTNVIIDIGAETNGKIIFDSETFSFSRVSVDYKNKMNEYTLFLYTANPYFTHLTLSPFQYGIDNVPYFTKMESAYSITRLAKIWVTGGTYCTWDRVANTITIPKGSVVKTGFSTYTLEDSVTISEITGNSGYVVFHSWYKTFKRISSTLNPAADEFIVCYYNNLEYGPYISLQPCTIINSNNDLRTLLTGGDYNQWIRQLQKPLRGSTQTSLVLLHFSDIHAHSANLSTINKVVNDAYFKLGTIDDVISTGDQIAQYYTDDFSFWSENGGNNFLQVIGNHETWKGGEEHASELDTYNKYFSPYIDSWGASYISGKCYYYKDYTNKNIRLIVLDCMHYDDNQNNWFIDALEDARSKNYTVVCAAHYIAGYPILMQDSAFCTLDYNQEAVLDYRAPLAVNEFINNGGDFACWIGGHYHKDILYTIDGYDSQVGVCIDSAFPYNDNADAYRTSNTYLYNLMNFISIDAVDGKFKIVRVGCNIDRYMRQKNMLCYDWRNKKLISSI